MFQELAMNFKLFHSGGETFKLRFYVGHDGSMIRLASGLGFGNIVPLRWPALGSEIVMEVSIRRHISLDVGDADVRQLGLANALQAALRQAPLRGNACPGVGVD